MPAAGLWKARQSAYRKALQPPRDALLQRILHDLETRGVAMTHLDDLARSGLPVPPDLIDRTITSLSEAASRTGENRKSYVTTGDTEFLTRDPDVFALGVESAILDVVEWYIGNPISFKGVQARCDRADGSKVETRLWHRDAEDRRIVKIIVYCDDVTEDDGPFCYVPKGMVPEHRIDYVDGRVPDATMDALVPRENRISCVGRKGTVVFADTCTVFHRGDVPRRQKDRATLWYIYNSREPVHPEYCAPLYASDWVEPYLPALTTRQRETLII